MCELNCKPIEPKDETWDEDMWWDALNGMPEPERTDEE